MFVRALLPPVPLSAAPAGWDAGIEYDFPGYASVGNGVGDDVGTATEKRPAKKTPAKRSAAAKEKSAPAKRPKTPAETTRTPAKRSARSAKA